MLIPHLHFYGDCKEAIVLYEKAFNAKIETVIRNSDYAPDEHNEVEALVYYLILC